MRQSKSSSNSCRKPSIPATLICEGEKARQFLGLDVVHDARDERLGLVHVAFDVVGLGEEIGGRPRRRWRSAI